MVTEKMKLGMKKALAMVLTVSMSTALFYVPGSPIEKTKEAEALAVGASRTFDATSTGPMGANTNNSYGTLGKEPTFPGTTGIYYWEVPYTGVYQIEALGANRNNGSAKGARIQGNVALNKGDILKILVGQTTLNTSAGAGGTFVTTSDNNPLIVAGGSGANQNATLTTAGGNVRIGYSSYSGYAGGCTGSYNANGGSNGNGGGHTNGGAGLTGNPSGNPKSFTNGGNGAVNGGFGGGATSSYGGGGGYSGGAGYATYSVCTETYDGTGWNFAGNVSTTNGGGGGGSYNSGTSPVNVVRADVNNNNHGQVNIIFTSPVSTQSPASGTKFQNSFIDVSWVGSAYAGASITKYEIMAGTTSGGNNIIPLTNKNMATTQRLTIPAGSPGNTTIYWNIRATDSLGNVGPWLESTVIYSNNIPKITSSTNVPADLDSSLEKRHHQLSINSLIDSDDFNYVTLFADVLDGSGTLIPGSKQQIVLDADLMSNSASLIKGTATEKDGSLQGPFNHATPFNLKLYLNPDFTTGKFDLTLTKADGVTNVIKGNKKLLTARTMQLATAPSPENYTLRIYPEDRQNTNTLANNPLASIPDVTHINMPFTSDTRNYLPRLTAMQDDVAERIFSDSQGFNKISVNGHVDDSDPADKITIYYEIQPKASNYSIQVSNQAGNMLPSNGVSTQTFNPKVDADFAFTYQIDSSLDSGNYALLVYGFDTQEGLGSYHEIPFTVDRGGPTIDFTADYTTSGGQKIVMSTAQKQIIAEDNIGKFYFTPNNYATFEYAGYLIRSGQVSDLRIRGAFTNKVKATFIGVDFGQNPITLMNGTQTEFTLGDVVVFKFKATSSTGIVTEKDVRVLIGNDTSTFAPLDDASLPAIP